MHNQFDENERNDLIYRSCVAAVAEGFPHLPMWAIIDPPHAWFDAALARQIALHIMVARFGVPKRRVALLRSRAAVYHGVKTVDARLDTAEFETHYRTMAARAEELLRERLAEAA